MSDCVADYKKFMDGDIVWVNTPSRISEIVRKEALYTLTNLINEEHDGKGFVAGRIDFYTYESVLFPTADPPWRFEDPNETTTDRVFGGLSLVNKRGKIAKRIRANLKNNYDIKISPRVVASIGSFINNNAMPPATWGFRLVSNSRDFIGSFGDEESCFQTGGCHSVHGEAIHDDPTILMMCVYDADEQPYARSWVHVAYDGALVFFNAYSKGYLGELRTRHIASLVAQALGLSTRRVDYETNIYQNHSWAIAVGGDRHSYGFDLEDLFTRFCEWCEEYRNHETYYVEDVERNVCEDCLHENFITCESCGEWVYYENAVTTDTSENYYCDACAKIHCYSCDRCGDWTDDPIVINWEDGDNYHGTYCYGCGLATQDRIAEDNRIAEARQKE